ncbi:MAG: DEAD/DEAH box helicase [Deltaproteobacteria bacterium]|nr:DEAD/DEAH box helicase [Deltaproteobacteria bacterium]
MSFKNFKFDPKIEAGIAACGYTLPTPIQKEAIPPILEGRDILGLAQTGTGKTAAFVLPLLQRLLDGPRKKVRALIVAPTRELAEQIHADISKMAQKTGLRSISIYGGVGKHPQIKAIRSGVEIIVACPGRLLDLLNDRSFSLKAVEALVLDEADHMFDKGFLPDIRRIIKQLPTKRQSLVFSATMPKEIRHLAENILIHPATVQINHTQPVLAISHVLFQVAKGQKTSLLKTIIKEEKMKSTLVFTRTKHKAKSLALVLQKAGYRAASIQGNLSQLKRQEALNGFKNGKFKILVATDIAARGIDVKGISHVINYDVPDTAETYTHRTGRTGRAERAGQAFIFAGQEDSKMISLIEHNLGKKMRRQVTPGFPWEPKEAVVEKKGKRYSRPMPRGKKPATGGRGRNQRSGVFSLATNKSRTALP